MKYDIIVIGAGSGGLNIASFMNRVGMKVLLIDKKDEFIGGDCLNFGCVPSKSLIHIASLFYNAKEANKFGKVSAKANIQKITQFIKDAKNTIRVHENADYFRKKGMDVVLGNAKFVGKTEVEVNDKVYSGKKIVLATGSRPRRLEIDSPEYFTNETIFDITYMPKRMLFIGAGPIGVEIAQSFSRLGTKVTIVDTAKTFLREDKEISQVLYDQLIEEGIQIHLNENIKEFKRKRVIFKSGRTVDFDTLFVAIGRELNLNLNLEKANIRIEGNKIKVNDYLETTNKKVLVCGDVAGGPMFTHAAELHAALILNNFFNPIKKKLSYDNFSWVTYTYPEIATFGLQAHQIKGKYEKLKLNFDEDDRSITNGYTKSKSILFIRDGKILGGSMVAPNAGEIYQELLLAKVNDLKIDAFFKKIYAYPTASRVNKRIISEYYGKKLTTFKKQLLRLLY